MTHVGAVASEDGVEDERSVWRRDLFVARYGFAASAWKQRVLSSGIAPRRARPERSDPRRGRRTCGCGSGAFRRFQGAAAPAAAQRKRDGDDQRAGEGRTVDPGVEHGFLLMVV